MARFGCFVQLRRIALYLGLTMISGAASCGPQGCNTYTRDRFDTQEREDRSRRTDRGNPDHHVAIHDHYADTLAERKKGKMTLEKQRRRNEEKLAERQESRDAEGIAEDEKEGLWRNQGFRSLREAKRQTPQKQIVPSKFSTPSTLTKMLANHALTHIAPFNGKINTYQELLAYTREWVERKLQRAQIPKSAIKNPRGGDLEYSFRKEILDGYEKKITKKYKSKIAPIQKKTDTSRKGTLEGYENKSAKRERITTKSKRASSRKTLSDFSPFKFNSFVEDK